LDSTVFTVRGSAAGPIKPGSKGLARSEQGLQMR
jgi:hypothetical protein